MKNVGYLLLRNRILSPYHSWKENRRNTSIPEALLPGFLGIGGHKCGSTWLHENLKHHPDVFLPEKKELHYFDLNFHRSWKWYARHFDGTDKLKGEITPAYGILSPKRISHIHHHIPNAKVLFIVRNPVERAWSHALMAFCTRNRKKPEDIPTEKFIEHFHRYNSTARTHYEKIYNNWVSVYGKDKIWVGFYQDIKNDPEGILTSCFKFLELPVPTTWDSYSLRTYFNRGPEFPIPANLSEKLAEMYRPLIPEWKNLFGEKVSDWKLG